MKWLEAIRRQEAILGSYCWRLTGFFPLVPGARGYTPQQRFAKKGKALKDNWQKPPVLSHSLSLSSLVTSQIIPASLPLTQTLVHYPCAGKLQSKTCFSSLPVSSKLLEEKGHLFTCARCNVVFFMARTRQVFFILSHLNRPHLPLRQSKVCTHAYVKELTVQRKKNKMYTVWTCTPSQNHYLLRAPVGWILQQNLSITPGTDG